MNAEPPAVFTLHLRWRAGPLPAKGHAVSAGGGAVILPTASPAVLARDANGVVRFRFGMSATGRPEVLVIAPRNQLLWRSQLSLRGPGPYSEKVKLPDLPHGAKVELVVKAVDRVAAKYGLQEDFLLLPITWPFSIGFFTRKITF